VSPTSFGPYTALRFSGFFNAPYTAQYDFYGHGCDGAIVWLDDQRTPLIAGNRAPRRLCCAPRTTVVPLTG